MPCKSWIIWLHFVISKSRDSTPYISSYQPTYVESAKLDLPDNFYTGGSILPQLPCRTNLLDPLRGKVRQKRQIDTQVVISSFARLTGPPGGASRLLIGSTHVSTQCVVRMASARHLPLSCFFFHPSFVSVVSASCHPVPHSVFQEKMLFKTCHTCCHCHRTWHKCRHLQIESSTLWKTFYWHLVSWLWGSQEGTNRWSSWQAVSYRQKAI